MGSSKNFKRSRTTRVFRSLFKVSILLQYYNIILSLHCMPILHLYLEPRGPAVSGSKESGESEKALLLVYLRSGETNRRD